MAFRYCLRRKNLATPAPTWLNGGDWLTLTLRFLLAVLIGGAIGLNRQFNGKAAGLRTHMLVSLGAALFVIVPLATSPTSDAGSVSRAVQGVATGVGFIGAGEILHLSRGTTKKSRQLQTVMGLTSAASLWVTAALGMVAAAGLWQIGVLGTILVLFILSGARWLERHIPVNPEDND
jgi:putative Mg2+ transporter-C (MgtC) family protein